MSEAERTEFKDKFDGYLDNYVCPNTSDFYITTDLVISNFRVILDWLDNPKDSSKVELKDFIVLREFSRYFNREEYEKYGYESVYVSKKFLSASQEIGAHHYMIRSLFMH